MQASFLFDKLCNTYNGVNSLFSMGLDSYARKKAAGSLDLQNQELNILDLFSGTGNNISFLLSTNSNLKIEALDQSEGMISIAREKEQHSNVSFIQSDFLNYDFEQKKYHAIICSYGLKCIPTELLEAYFSKLEKILEPQGQIILLDVFYSKKNWINKLFQFYFQSMLRLHPKLNKELRQEYLSLRTYLSSFDRNAFMDAVEKQSSFTIERVKLNVPLNKIYKITKQ